MAKQFGSSSTNSKVLYGPPTSQNLQYKIRDDSPQKQIQKSITNLPFIKDYEIVFKEQDLYKIQINAQINGLQLIVASHGELKVWKGDFKSNQLEEISRKTGREIQYLNFVQMLDQALSSQETNQNQAGLIKNRHLFIDFLCYEDLQLLKARRGEANIKYSALKERQNFPQDLSRQKMQKRYLILTYLEKYNLNENQEYGQRIREEIEVENDKTHYPLPLSIIEISDYNSLIQQQISPQILKFMIKQMSELISNQGLSQQSHTSGFGLENKDNSFMNRTIKSDFSNSTIQRKTAREFFSKDNQDHPLIQENSNLKQQIKHLKNLKDRTSSSKLDLNSSRKSEDIQSQLTSYQNFVNAEKDRLLSIQQDLQASIENSKSELYSQSDINSSKNEIFSQKTSDIEEMRKKLAETSIELQEQKERYIRNIAKNQKELEFNEQQLEQVKGEERKMRIKINQLENDLVHQIKRLDIICKSKGLPRPNKELLNLGQSGSQNRNNNGSYVSPYARSRVSPGQSNASNNGTTNSKVGYAKQFQNNQRQNSQNSSQNRQNSYNKYQNSYKFTPDNKNKQVSPAVSGKGSTKFGAGADMEKIVNNKFRAKNTIPELSNQNRMRRNQVGNMMRSPSVKSEKSVKSSGYGVQSQYSGNKRLQSPNGTIQNPPGYTSHSGVNRVRRDGVTMSGNKQGTSQSGVNQYGRLNSGKSIGSQGRISNSGINNRGQYSERSKSNISENSNKIKNNNSNMLNIAQNSKFVVNTRTIQQPKTLDNKSKIQNLLKQQENDANNQIEDKISKLQNLLKIAKNQ